jgi:hypothetical protein
MSRRATLKGLLGPSEPKRIVVREYGRDRMRTKGYLVASTQTLSLPVIGASRQTANWYRVTFELASPRSAGAAAGPGSHDGG